MSTEARAIKTSTTFRMDCSVQVRIRATPGHIWALLTDAVGFPRWNSTVTRIEGTIAEGQTLKSRCRPRRGACSSPGSPR